MKKLMAFLMLLVFVPVVLTSCNENNEPPVVETQKFTVTFNANGGSSVTAIEVEDGQKVNKPTDPTRSGYTFEGWYVDQALTTKFDFNNPITANTTLYAKWTEVVQPVPTYSVTYVTEHGQAPAAVNDVTALPATLPVLEAEGYTFGGWYLDQACTTIATAGAAITANITLYAKWTEVVQPTPTYSVTYVTEYGQAPAVVSDVTALPATLPVLEAEGYTFGGWYIDQACTTIATAGAAITANTTLYAKWTEVVQPAPTYSVTYFTEHGQAPASLTGVTALPLTLPVLVADGYVFGGWYLDEACTTVATAGSSITANTTLYAKWTEATYSVTYVTEYGQAPAGLTGVTALPLTLPVLEAEGYVFGGWYEDENCTIRAIAGDAIVSNMTLYAKWTVNTYEVTFDAQGGSVVTGATLNHGSLITKPLEPTKANHTFGGWYKDAACTTAWNFEIDKVTADTTLYAKWTINSYKVTFNAQGGSTVAEQTINYDGLVVLPAQPTKDGCVFGGWFTEVDCTNEWDFAENKVTGQVTLYAKWISVFDVTFVTEFGTAPAGLEAVQTLPTTLPELTYSTYLFGGWYYDAEFTNMAVAGEVLTQNVTLYARWLEKIERSVDFNDYCDGSTLTEPLKIGNVTLLPGVGLAGDGTSTIDGVSYKRIKTNGAAKLEGNIPVDKALKVELGGPGSVTFHMAPAGSGERTLYVVDQDGNKLFENTTTSSTKYSHTIEVDKETTLYFYGTNGQNFYKLDSVWYIGDRGDINGFKLVKPGVVDYLEGTTELDLSKLVVYNTYTSGYEEEIFLGTEVSNFKLDTSEVDFTTPGQYKVYISYKEYEKLSYVVTIYDTVGLEAHTSYMVKDSENIWGNNSALRNYDSQLLYLGEGAIDTKALTVYVCANLVVGSDELTHKFRLNEEDFEVTSNAVFTTSGTYKVNISSTINGTPFETEYNIYVVLTEPAITDNVVTVTVDATYDGVIGEVQGSQGNMFKTVKQAVEFLTNHEDVTNGMIKVINVKSGYYFEKVDIAIPNVKLIGDNADTTIIEFDAANGLTDARGTQYSTDGSATVSVRYEATNFTAYNITFSNEYNTLAKYNDLKDETPGTQALAIMLQADRSSFYGCRFLGYQDTIEMQGAGRQYFEDCFVQGATDFIFGTNSSALFEGCEIYVISNGQAKNGGYICAPKGNNKSDDQTQYGYIFNDCDFTSDGLTTANTTAICRPWASYAYVTVMNSRLGEHISKIDYDGQSQGRRYCSGLGGDCTAATCIFQEYNNTGEGALTESSTVMEILSKEQADALLASFWNAYTVASFEFEAWTPVKDNIETFGTVKEDVSYSFDTTAADYVVTNNDLAALTVGDIYVSVGNATITASGMSVEAGSVIRFAVMGSKDVLANVILTIDSGSTLINGIVATEGGFDEVTVVEITFAEATLLRKLEVKYEQVFVEQYGVVDTIWYLDGQVENRETNAYSYTLDTQNNTINWKGLEIDASIGKLTYNASGYTQFNKDTKIKFSVEKNAMVTIIPYPGQAKYTVNGVQVEQNADSYVTFISEAGNVEIVATGGAYIKCISVAYGETWFLDGTTELGHKQYSYTGDTQGSVVNFNGLNIDATATNGKLTYNASGYTQFNKDTVITFTLPHAAYVNIKSYSGQAKFTLNGVQLATSDNDHTEYMEAGVVNITATGGAYLYSVSYYYGAAPEPVVPSSPISVNTSFTYGATVDAENNVYALGMTSGNGLTISGTTRDNGDSIQLQEGAKYSLEVVANATITIQGHSTSYGQLAIYVDGDLLEIDMDANAIYTVTTTKDSLIEIAAKEVSGGYSNSYIKGITITFA